jgi:hypothetical protein
MVRRAVGREQQAQAHEVEVAAVLLDQADYGIRPASRARTDA